MHFDEVYHARTAAEFLQAWRYGEPHDIYEFTHPHVAKYLIAAGMVAFGNERVTGSGTLGAPATAAAVETRWSPDDRPAERNGDRLYVASGTDVRVLDLASRALVTTIPVAATAMAVDEDGHQLYLGDAEGALWSLPTASLDSLRIDPSKAGTPPAATRLLRLDGRPTQLGVFGDEGRVVALLEGGRVQAVDPAGRTLTATATVEGATAVESLDGVQRVVAVPSEVSDPEAAARLLAEALGEGAGRIQELLEQDADRVVLASFLTEEQDNAVSEALDGGQLAGVSIEDKGALAVAAGSGVSILDGETLDELRRVALDGPATGLVLVEGVTDKDTLYIAAGARLERVELAEHAEPSRVDEVWMPAEVGDVVFDRGVDERARHLEAIATR